MFNKCAVNALFGRPGRMRKVKCDNRNEEKGHFLCPALGTDVITAAHHLVCTAWGSTMGHNAGDCRVKVDQLQYKDDVTGKKKTLMLIPQAFLVCMSVIIPAVLPAICCVNIQLSKQAVAGDLQQEEVWKGSESKVTGTEASFFSSCVSVLQFNPKWV